MDEIKKRYLNLLIVFVKVYKYILLETNRMYIYSIKIIRIGYIYQPNSWGKDQPI